MFNRCFPAVLLAASFCTLMRADCVDGMRPATQAEKTFHVSTLTALKASLPPAPAGWTLTDNTRIVEPATACGGAEKIPAILRYEVTYLWVDGEKTLSAQRAEKSRRSAEIRALPPDQQKESEELARKSRDLDRQSRKAAGAGDKAEAARLKQESADLAKQSWAIQDAHLKSVRGQLDTLMRESQAQEKMVKTQVRFELAVNWPSVQLTGETLRPAYAGVPLALRSGEQTVLCFGPCTVSSRAAGSAKYTDIKLGLKPGKPPTSVHTVLVRAYGTPRQVDDVLAGFKSAAMMQLLSQ